MKMGVNRGAVGLPDYLIYAYYFYQKDTMGMDKKQSQKYMNQKFQEIIFNLNQPYLKSGIQSAYTNFSILDTDHLVKFFGEEIYPDGSDIMTHIGGIFDFQQSFLDYIGELRQEKWHTFPVISSSLIFRDGGYVDEDTAKMVVDHNWKFGFNDVNIMNVEEATSLASCCFDGTQKILTRSSTGGIKSESFEVFFNRPYNENKTNLKIFHNGSWVEGKAIKLPKKQLYKITTANNKELVVTEDHINPTTRGDLRTDELTEQDYLMFNTNKLDAIPEQDLRLSYNDGIIIGAYLGDGSMIYRGGEMVGVNFSLSKDKVKRLLPIMIDVLDSMDINVDILQQKPTHNNYPVVIYSKKLCDFIKQWTDGKYAHEKELNINCLSQSVEFREGVLEGYYITDGGNSNRIYTSSELMSEQLEVLITSLGKQSIIDLSDRTDEPVIIRGGESNRNYPIYCIRWYNGGNRRSMKNVYKLVNNSMFFKIKSIEKIDTKSESVYCFEMKSEDEPYFTLPNGVITHNCRLVSNKDELNQNKVFNSIGGSDVNIGSTKVVTLNLVRLALLSKNKEDFMQLVKEKTELIHKYHFAHRKTLQKLVDKGLLPLYTHGLMSFEDQFATVGINGVYEAIKAHGGISEDENGTYYNKGGFELAKRMFDVVSDSNSTTQEEYGYMSNVEQVPAESTAVKLNKKDRLYFGNRFINDKLGEECYIYGNQWIPLKENTNIFHRIDAAKLDNYCGGGAILHINLGENFNSFEDAWEFTNGLAKKGVKYFSYISLIDICADDHSFFGDTCPVCNGKSVSKGIKIVGYLVKQDSYKKERKQELTERKFYNIA